MPRAAKTANPRTADAPDTRERLLRAGLALASTRGLNALTVRAVAAEAGANLGSFVYHFGTRDAFVEALVERWYAPLMADLQGLARAPSDALSHLREALLRLVDWVIANREFVGHLVLAASAGEGAARRFLSTMDRRHPVLLLQLIGQAQASGHLRPEPPLHVMLFLMSTLALPVPVLHLLSQQAFAPAAMLGQLQAYATDRALVAERLGWALRGLAP